MPTQVCIAYDTTCEECLLGRARPHNYKKWTSPTGWCRPIEQQIPIEEGRTEKDWVMGGQGAYNQDILMPNGQWLDNLVVKELQRNGRGDVWGCVSFSAMNCCEIIYKKRYGEEVNFSDRKVVVGSGTDPKKGNSMNTVAEYIRTMWTVLESEYPYSPTMTIEEYYQAIPQDVITKALQSLKNFEVNHAWLPRANGGSSVFSTPDQIKEALTYSPVQACVGPNEERNGIIYFSDSGVYFHAITIVGYVEGKHWIVFDSETLELTIYDWNYRFGFPKIYSLKKKEPRVFYKELDKPAIYQKGEDGMYYGIDSGTDFKSLFGEFSSNQIIQLFSIPPELKSSKKLKLV